MQSEKYGRTYHYPFSPGTTSDDRINFDYWNDLQQIKTVVHTEKLDGENNCLSKWGVFARSHAAPATSPWTATLREFWHLVKNDLGDLEIFLEVRGRKKGWNFASPFCFLPSAFCLLLSAFCFLLSAFCLLLSASLAGALA